VFVVGFGSGTTIGSILRHPVEKLTCVEISTEVIEAAYYFKEANNNCLIDSRLKIVHEDAHTFLNLSKEKYDVLISEPSNPWIAGIGNLFSEEYFHLCSGKLKEDGIMVQWLQTYETSDEVVQLVLNTFNSVFPHSQIWRGNANDLIIVGSKKEITLNENEFKRKFNIKVVKQDFERIGIKNPFTFLSAQLLSDKGTFLLARDEPTNSEKNPVLEFLAPRALFLGSQSNLINVRDEKLDTLNKGLYIKDYIKNNIPTQEDIIGAAFYHSNVTKNYQFCYGLTKYLESESLNSYDSDVLSAMTYKKFNLHNVRTIMHEELSKKYPESVIIQQEYLNDKLSETTTASTFLKIFSMKEISKEFIKISSSNTDLLPYVYLQVAEGLLSNSEIISAYIVSVQLEKWLNRNPKVVKNFPMDRFYYTYAVILIHLKDAKKYSYIYSRFQKKYPNSPKLISLQKRVEWEERK